MSEHKPRLIRAEGRAVLFEECSHDESVVPVSETTNSFKVIIDRGDANVRYSEWLDTEVYRGYVADSGGEIYYCRVAEVRGPGLGRIGADTSGPGDCGFSVVNPDGSVVEFGMGDSLEIYQGQDGAPYVRMADK